MNGNAPRTSRTGDPRPHLSVECRGRSGGPRRRSSQSTPHVARDHVARAAGAGHPGGGGPKRRAHEQPQHDPRPPPRPRGVGTRPQPRCGHDPLPRPTPSSLTDAAGDRKGAPSNRTGGAGTRASLGRDGFQHVEAEARQAGSTTATTPANMETTTNNRVRPVGTVKSVMSSDSRAVVNAQPQSRPTASPITPPIVAMMTDSPRGRASVVTATSPTSRRHPDLVRPLEYRQRQRVDDAEDGDDLGEGESDAIVTTRNSSIACSCPVAVLRRRQHLDVGKVVVEFGAAGLPPTVAPESTSTPGAAVAYAR